MNSACSILRKIKMPLCAAILMMCAATAPAETAQERTEISDSLHRKLSELTSASDSIPVLYDIFDLSTIDSRLDNASRLLETARHAGNVEVQLDMLRHIASHANATYDEATARRALNDLLELPASEERRQTEVFVRTSLAGAHRFNSESERDSYLRQILKAFTEVGDEADIYDRATQLFILVQVLQDQTQGLLVAEYIDKLAALLKQMPRLQTDFLGNKLNTTAAIVYWHNDEPEKSVEADRKLLKIMDGLEKHYSARNRRFRNYDVQRYVSLRRMVRNYEVLTTEEVDSINAMALEIAARNPEIQSDYDNNPTFRVSVLLKHGQYDEALTLVKQLAGSAKGLDDKRFYLKQLIKVADLAGDTDLKLRTEAENSHLLEEYIAYKSGERMRELQMLYDVSTLRQAAAENEIARTRTRTLGLFIAGVTLAVLLVVFVFLYFRFRTLLRKFKSVNAALKDERATLISAQQDLIAARDKARQAETEKSQLISYLGHVGVVPLTAITEYTQMIIDNLHGEDKEYLRKFARVVEANVRILQEIGNDAQEFSLMENHKLTINRTAADTNVLARIAVASLKPQLKPGVTISVDSHAADDGIIITDPRRVASALMALLSNAVKFTDKGSVTLTIDIDRDKREATFTVTDTGIGVPADKAEQIFQRFERLNNDRQGIGMGLPNCAMIANALGGSVRLDTSYPGPGARFIFTILTE